MRFTTAAFALAAFASSALAHMELTSPAPFRSKDNKFATTTDFDMTSPLLATGTNFPCKGYQSDFTTPAGTSTATWVAGSQQQITLDGGAPHNGGSCQLSMSYDGGKTFRVIQSIEGNCANPTPGPQNFSFTVPADAKSGKAIFAWTWFNHTGNREMYMNCAAVDITGSGTSELQDRPEIFTANIGNGCTVPEGTDVQFPNPGPDVQVLSKASLGPPTGNCAVTSSPSSAPNNSEPTPSSATSSHSPAPTESADPTEEPCSTSTSQAPASTTTPGSDVGTTYTVVSGDTCDDIAAKNNVPVNTIMTLNPQVNSGCTNLMPDQVINLRRRSRIMRNLN
jgi:LysM repeat protein